MVDVQYKKKEWEVWVVWPCQDKEEAEKVTAELQKRGYEVKGKNPKIDPKRM